MSPSEVRKREEKWLKMLENWDKFFEKEPKKVHTIRPYRPMSTSNDTFPAKRTLQKRRPEFIERKSVVKAIWSR